MHCEPSGSTFDDFAILDRMKAALDFLEDIKGKFPLALTEFATEFSELDFCTFRAH